MATRVMNFKVDESVIVEMKEVAGIYNMTVTDLIKQAVREYMDSLKADPYYRLSANIREASAKESEEILKAIDNMSDDDLTIVSKKQFTV